MADRTACEGIVLLAHGSRDERWRQPIEAVAARVQALDRPWRWCAAPTSNWPTPDLRTAAASAG